ncbi:MAG: 30S ribosomal protein S3 [Candidatus Sungbacteria bacterium]|nr:30S ribosomal protein S3 [Candidatus Sungbacteria bacterium]
MTHRVHPYIFRIGQTKTWKSRWFNLKKFREYLREDMILREWLDKKLRQMHIEVIEIERSPNILHIIIKTARPGLLIGRGGEGAENLKKEIEKMIIKIWKRVGRVPEKRELKLTIEEVRSPETHAAIVGQMIADSIEKRMPYRRVLKQSIEKTAGMREVKGVKILIKGRLDGNDIARVEWMKRGRIPLQTLRADIDYAEKTAYTTYGTVGIKVWIYKGEVFEEK